MKQLNAVVVTLSCTLLLVAAQKPFERVEQLPEGEQGGTLRSLTSVKDTHTETVTITASYAHAWAAVKAAAQKLDKLGKRPIVSVNEQSGRIQNGKIQLESMALSSTLMDWRDEIITEITAIDDRHVKLSVSRKLVHHALGDKNWSAHMSNGKVERWFITQVSDELKKPTQALSTPATISQSAISQTFVSKDNSADVLELRNDKTFVITQQGHQMSGTYEWSADSLTLNVGSARLVGHLAGEVLTDNENKLWTRRASPSTSTPEFSGDVVRNEDIIKLSQAKLQDGIIISKIKNSLCRFNLSTDALIKLKEANVSDAVVQAMTEAPKK